MKKLLIKEIRLAASPLSFLFLACRFLPDGRSIHGVRTAAGIRLLFFVSGCGSSRNWIDIFGKKEP